MGRARIAFAMAAAAGALAGAPGAACVSDDAPPRIAPARDGNIAIRQELEATRKVGTPAAYDLFIARHPRHPLAAVARKERERLLRRTRR